MCEGVGSLAQVREFEIQVQLAFVAHLSLGLQVRLLTLVSRGFFLLVCLCLFIFSPTRYHNLYAKLSDKEKRDAKVSQVRLHTTSVNFVRVFIARFICKHKNVEK